MDKEIDDIKKLDAIIMEENDHNIFRDEFDDFINHSISDDEQLDGVDEEELTEIEGVVDNIVNKLGENIYHNVENLNFSADLNLVKRFLSLEEIKVINVCKDAKLKRLLILNRAKHVQLQNIRYRLYELLRECKMSLKTAETQIEKSKKQGTHYLKSIIPKLGHPYFKTKDFYSCGPNADTIRKQKSKEICIDYLPQLSRWTVEDQVTLKGAIIFNYTTYLIDKLESNLKVMEASKKVSTKAEATTDIETSILSIKQKLTVLQETTNQEPPPLNSDVEINWLNISKCDFGSRHLPEACKGFWNIFLHPSINKEDWTEAENMQIIELARKYKFQNWDLIADELNNSRSGFVVCFHYYSSLFEKIRKDKFDPEEDQFLVDVVNACRIGNYIPWSKVGHYFQNRSRSQLYHRYRYCLKYTAIKKGSFSQAEDALLTILVRKFGRDFHRCSKYIPHRAPNQLAHRYINYLTFDQMDLGCYTLEDDEIIMDHVKQYGEKEWSKLFPTFKTRNRTHLRQRYFYIKKWLLNHPEKTLKELPRKARYKRVFDNKWAVNLCIEHFSTSHELPSLYEINDYLRKLSNKSISLLRHQPVTYHPPNVNIDKELIKYFQSTCKIRTSKIISGTELNHIVDIIKTIMAMFDVEFLVPTDELLHQNLNLDVLDVEILTLLFSNISIRENNCTLPSTSITINYTPTVQALELQGCERRLLKFHHPSIISYLPPNINSLVGLRSLLLLHQSYESKHTKKNQVETLNVPTDPVIKVEADDIVNKKQNVIVTDEERFYTRFNSIFKWSALMSLVKPKESLFVNKSANKAVPCIVEPPKVGRPKKNMIKIQLMNQARIRNKKSSNEPSSNVSQITVIHDTLQTVAHTPTNQSDTQTSANETKLSKTVDIKGITADLKSSDNTKRSLDSEREIVPSKKVKMENDDCSNELALLRGDIDKLDNVLNMELNKIKEKSGNDRP